MPLKPRYPHKSIATIRALSLALGVRETELRAVAANANHLYRLAAQETKSDGSIRQTFDALPRLKTIHEKIKTKIFKHVVFPEYLTGSLKGQSPKKNAELHLNASIIISEDISGFFPATSSTVVGGIWKNFFGFSPEVAALLTQLTTLDGSMPQGAKTSSYLANLAFWDREPALVSRLAADGIRYSRYVDDVTASSKTPLSSEKTAEVIAAIYGMLNSKGYRQKRIKHDISRSNNRMTATKLVVSNKAGLPKDNRATIRTKVFQLERVIQFGTADTSTWLAVRSTESHVARLALFHPGPAKALKSRLTAVKTGLVKLGFDRPSQSKKQTQNRR